MIRVQRNFGHPATQIQVCDHGEFLCLETSESRSINRLALEMRQAVRQSAFIGGLSTITALVAPFVLKDVWLLSPAQLSLMATVMALPCVALRPILAGYLLNSGRRTNESIRNTLIISTIGQVGTACGFAAAIALNAPLYVPLTLLALRTLFNCASSVCRDACVYKLAGHCASDWVTTISESGSMFLVGSLLASYPSGWVLPMMGASASFVLSGALSIAHNGPILNVLCDPSLNALCSTEINKSSEIPSLTLRINEGISSVSSSNISGAYLSTLLPALAPSFDDALFFYLTNSVGLVSQDLGVIRMLGSCSALLGTLYARGTHLSSVATSSVEEFVDDSNLAGLASLLVNSSAACIPFLGTSMPSSFALSVLCVRQVVMDYLLAINGVGGLAGLFSHIPKAALFPGEAALMSASVSASLGEAGSIVNGLTSSLSTRLFGITSTEFGHLGEYMMTCSFASLLVSPLSFTLPNRSNRVHISKDCLSTRLGRKFSSNTFGVSFLF